jgi:glycosyltransferase involved in cell wall biosynthesis
MAHGGRNEGTLQSPSVDVVLVAHNEEETLASTIEGFLALPDVAILVAEDGSSDRTRDVADGFAVTGRVRVTPPAPRKGYSRAVADAVAHTRAPVIVFCDGDGQYEPEDLAEIVGALQPGVVVAGARSPRRDSRRRILASRAFGLAYRLLVPLRMADPSSPFVGVFRDDLAFVLDSPPVLPQGFWWEFFARADAAGLQIVEVPVRHRAREVGSTQVYRPARLPGIVATHLVGLVRLRRQLRRTRAAREAPPLVAASIPKTR